MASRMRTLLSERRNQRGTTLVEVVIAMVLFFAIGGSFVYASIVLESARKQSLTETKSTITQSAVSNSFRADINGAKALKLSSANNLLVARSDGKCVSWTVSRASGATTSKVFRSEGQWVAASSTKNREFATGVSSAAFSVDAENAGFNIVYSKGGTLKENLPIRLSGSDGGVCW